MAKTRKQTILKAIGAILGVLALGLIVVANTGKDTFSVERSIVINAPMEKVFSLVNTFAFWVAWSPFEKDPNMKRTLIGPPKGVGSAMEWDGNSDVGAGRAEIYMSEGDTEIEIKLDMTRPFKQSNKVNFLFVPEGGGIKVTWRMSGATNLMSKVINLFMSCEEMIGPEFEKGLEKLKAVAERG